MRRHARTWLTTLALALTLGGCLPCVPGVQIDPPRTAACLAAADGQCAEIQGAPKVATHPSGGDSARLR
jgi:hypothetical protein